MRYAVDDTIEYIDHLAQQLEVYEPASVVTFLLIRLRIPTNFDGFTYLQTAILLRCAYPLSSMSADIYPAIRRLYGDHLTDKTIDSAMRGAILAGWMRGDIQAWKLLLPTVLYAKTQRPSSTEFVGELARIVELLCNCAKGYRRQTAREEADFGIT